MTRSPAFSLGLPAICVVFISIGQLSRVNLIGKAHGRPHRLPFRRFALIAVTLGMLSASASVVLGVSPAEAHGFTSSVYVDVVSPASGHVQTAFDLEYDLLVSSAAEKGDDPGLFEQGMDLFQTGEEATALNSHADTVVKYVTERFAVAADGAACVPARVGNFTVSERDAVPYARLILDYACAQPVGQHEATHELTSGLFPDSEDYVTDTKTIVTYELDGRSGSAVLDAAHPSFSTGQSGTDRFGEFFVLGAEHLLSGLDHILFLLALIVGSRRLRDVVLAATTFTVAHSVTFLLAALGVVAVPAAIVEPIIALSIAVVALWYLWGEWTRRRHPYAVPVDVGRRGLWGLDRADAVRLAVVFCFGLVHGLGFAGALGIDEAWSWSLLWSLLVFNVGIEAVQLGIIAIVFPILAVLRHRAPRVGLWASIAVTGFVAVIGLFWFVERLLGAG